MTLSKDRKGKCCRKFCLPLSIGQLKKDYETWHKGDKEYVWSGKTFGITQDIDLIYPMVTPLGDGKIQHIDPARNCKSSKGIYHYTCKHLDKKSSRCSIYENRPRMCKLYPYGVECAYKNCYCEHKIPKKDK